MSSLQGTVADRRHQVVVIGSGFGGLFATQALKHADVDVTLIAKTTHHLFQPLLYQVATGILSEGEIAPSTREILGHQRNSRVLLGEVTDIDLAERTVTSTALGQTRVTSYDSLVVAAGAGQSYFGNDHFATFAPGMKSIDDALELRGRIFGAFEMAERETDPDKRREWLTVVVVGGGPTGVDTAAQLAELSKRSLHGTLRHIDPARALAKLIGACAALSPPSGNHPSACSDGEHESEAKKLETKAQSESFPKAKFSLQAQAHKMWKELARRGGKWALWYLVEYMSHEYEKQWLGQRAVGTELDYNIFFATQRKPGKDTSGDKIFVKRPASLVGDDVRSLTSKKNGQSLVTSTPTTKQDEMALREVPETYKTGVSANDYLLDLHGHLIVNHDLFNHDGLTQDGIAEAFQEFAKKEKLSFF